MSNSIDFISSPFYIEGLYVEPSQNIIIIKNETHSIQPKVMEVLTYLCTKQQKLVTNDQIISACWPNQYIGDSPLHKCIAQLRKVLGDDPKHPRFIKTIPKKGYVFIAKVQGLDTQPEPVIVSWVGESPYAGMHPYTFEQSSCFFGREQVVEDIYHWVTQKYEDEPMWLLLSGPSGIGKSSLVYAGLLPKLVTHTFVDKTHQEFCITLDLATLPCLSTPHFDLLLLLIRNEHLSTSLSKEYYGELISNQIKNPDNTELDEDFKSHILTKDDHSRFVVFIDHIEVLFSANSINRHASKQTSEQVKSYFFKLLDLLVSSKKCFLITAIDEQSTSDLYQFYTQDDGIFNYKVPGFSHTELIDIINKPAELAGLSFEYDEESRECLNNLILQQLIDDYIPIVILQHLLKQLYLNNVKRKLTLKAYKSIGGITGCLISIAEKSYLSLTEQEKESFESCLFHLLKINKFDEIVITSCPMSTFTGKHALSVIGKLLNIGVLRITYRKSNAFIMLSHNSLFSAWTRIDEWIQRNRDTLSLRYELDTATRRWLRHNKSNAFLLHCNNQIKQLSQLVASEHFSIDEDEKKLVSISKTFLACKKRIKKLIAVFLIFALAISLLLSVSLNHKNEQVITARTNAENLISFILYDLKDKLEPLGKVELLNMVASETRDYFDVVGTDNLTGDLFYQWVEALHTLGEVNINKNNYVEAELYFNQTAKALKNALKSDENNEQLLELIMLANYWLGYSAYLQLNYDAAKPFFINYLKYATQLAKLYPSMNWQLEQSYALNNLGSLAEKKHLLSVANDYFEQSALIKIALLEIQPNNLSLRVDLADTRSWQSNIQAKNGKLILAISYLKRALSQIEKISSIEESFYNIETLANSEHKLALLYYDNGDLMNALHHSQKAEKSLMRLVNNDKNNFLYKEDLLWSYLLSVQIYINQGKHDIALVLLNKADKLLNQLRVSETKKSQLIRANVYFLQQQAQVMASLKQYQTALVTITDAIKLYEQYLSEETDISFYARVALTKFVIMGMVNEVDKVTMHQGLDNILKSLTAKLIPTNPDYDAISIYLTILKFMDKLHLDDPWLKLYESSDYNIPDYSIISSMDIKNKN